MKIGVGLSLTSPAVLRLSFPLLPLGFAFVTFNGDYVTFNGDYVIAQEV